MHIGAVAIFEEHPLLDANGQLRMDDLRKAVADRLCDMPKLRWHVKSHRGLALRPVWVDSADFDIAYHVREAALPAPGTQEQLAQLCADILSEPLEPGRPLWQLWLIGGVEGRRVALVEKIHHSLADGLAGVEVATVLLDAVREPRPTRGRRDASWLPTPPPTLPKALWGKLAHIASLPLRSTAGSIGALRHPRRALSEAAHTAGALGTLLTPGLLAPRSSLNVRVGHGRRLVFIRESLADIRQVESANAVTLNDVLLTAVAGGLSRLLAGRGEQTSGREAQVLVPVGFDHVGDGHLGNRISAMLVRVPLGMDDPLQILRAIASAMAIRKRQQQALAGTFLQALAEPLPEALIAPLAWGVHHQPFVNLVVTNVPGPDFPLYALGAQMLEVFPVVPLAANLPVGIAALSYNGSLGIGILADRDGCPDVDVLGTAMLETFAKLTAASRPTKRPTTVRRPGRAGRPGGAGRVRQGPSRPGGIHQA